MKRFAVFAVAWALAGAAQAFTAWDEVRQRAAVAPRADDEQAQRVAVDLGLDAHFVNLFQNVDAAYAKAAALARAIALPTAEASWFRGESDIAPLGEDAAALASRFGVAVQTRTQARTLDDAVLSKVTEHHTALAQPVHSATLFRDGRITHDLSRANRTRTDWGEFDAPMCEGWQPGFAHGDADARLWLADPDRAAVKPARAKGSLLQVHLRRAPPLAQARTFRQTLRLDRAATGFVRATQWHFDLDADGRPDLAAVEAVGNGPGDIGGPTGTDDAWYRLFFVNIAGRWHVLGHDVFSYGCGC